MLVNAYILICLIVLVFIQMLIFFKVYATSQEYSKTEELLEEITATVLWSNVNAIKATRYEAHPFQPAEEVHGKVNFQSAKVSLSVA